VFQGTEPITQVLNATDQRPELSPLLQQGSQFASDRVPLSLRICAVLMAEKLCQCVLKAKLQKRILFGIRPDDQRLPIHHEAPNHRVQRFMVTARKKDCGILEPGVRHSCRHDLALPRARRACDNGDVVCQ
jgi:hypothetical protein